MSDSSNNFTLAMLAVDLQSTFLNVMENGELMKKRSLFALEVAGLLDIPVFITEQYPEKLGHTDEQIKATAGANARYFSKTSFSAFGAEGLVEEFSNKSVQHLLVLGLEVPICIYNTVVEAGSRDIACTLLSDCISARRKEDAEVCLDFLRGRSDCHILPSETIFYSLLRDAKDPLFREFTKLVKKYS